MQDRRLFQLMFGTSACPVSTIGTKTSVASGDS